MKRLHKRLRRFQKGIGFRVQGKNLILIGALVVAFLGYVALADFSGDSPRTAELVALPVSANYHETGFVTPASCGVVACPVYGDARDTLEDTIGYCNRNNIPLETRDFPDPDEICAPPPTPTVPTLPDLVPRNLSVQ
ncbi:hypothetical protein HY504_01025 [Candidatus Wolfebacteria bacterium]|nr:hypothetical protein [Candidatus Wolfebacteria bacterium]